MFWKGATLYYNVYTSGGYFLGCMAEISNGPVSNIEMNISSLGTLNEGEGYSLELI